MIKELQLLGLTENEAIVYSELVRLGTCKAGALISRLDLHRNLVYRALDSLAENGYITKVTKNGVWHFQISDPASLLISAKRKEEIYSEVLKVIEEQSLRSGSQIVVYEGLQSYRNYWLQSLEKLPKGTIDYVAGGEIVQWSKLMGKAKEEYTKKATKLGLEWKSLYFKKPVGEELLLLTNINIRNEYRILEAQTIFPGNFNVIGDTVILHTPIAKMPKIVEMTDPALVNMFKGMFDLMWSLAQKPS